MATVITWLDGKVQRVPADDPRVQQVEADRVRAHHVANMRRLDVHGRRDYLDAVERREGIGARMMLQEEFIADWEASRK